MRILTALAIALLAAVLFFYWLQPGTPDSTSEDAEPGEETLLIPASQNQAGQRTLELLDIPITVTAAGDLVPDTRIKQLFDTFADQHIEEPVDGWKQQILLQFSDQLPAPALAQLQELLNRYVEFNLALQLLPMEGAPNLSAVLQRVRELREHYLGKAVADTMYADWNELEAFTRQYLEIMTRNRNPEESQSQLETLAEALPEPVQQRALSMIRHSDEEVSVPRIAKVDPDAYSRMLQEQVAIALIETQLLFDEPSPEFMDRYEHYAEERQTLLKPDVDVREQLDQLKELRAKYFSGADVLRVETLDRAEAF